MESFISAALARISDGCVPQTAQVRIKALADRGTSLVATVAVKAGDVVLVETCPLVRVTCMDVFLNAQRRLQQLQELGCRFDFWDCFVRDPLVCTCLRDACEAAPPRARQALAVLSDCFDAGIPGIFLTNCIQLPGWPVARGAASGDFAVYSTYSRMNHSCDANVRLEHGVQGELEVFAIRDIDAGEEIVDNYLAGAGDELGCRRQMRLQLRERWRFDCDCIRCVSEGLLLPTVSAGGGGLPHKLSCLDNVHCAPSTGPLLMGINSWTALHGQAGDSTAVEAVMGGFEVGGFGCGADDAGELSRPYGMSSMAGFESGDVSEPKESNCMGGTAVLVGVNSWGVYQQTSVENTDGGQVLMGVNAWGDIEPSSN